MNLLIFVFFGYLGIVCAIYKIPKHDQCVLMVLLCDDYTKPLTPVDNSTLEMFETREEINAVCKNLSNFRSCLKNARTFCMAKSEINVGFELLENRQLAFDLCENDSAYQQEYMLVQECVNKYSHTAIKFCTDKAVETVGLNFYLGDLESECRFLGTIQHCHIAVVESQCGIATANMLKRLVVFRGERDFMCIGYERDILENLESFLATMDSYVQQYNNTLYQIELEEAEKIDRVKKSDTRSLVQDRTSSPFQSRISPILSEDSASDIEHMSNREQPSKLYVPPYTENLPQCSCVSGQGILDSKNASQDPSQNPRHFYEQRSDQILSEENYACKRKVSFLLMGIFSNGKHYLLGYGEADVLWAIFSPLKDISCAWMVNPAVPTPLAKCSILIDNSDVARKDCKTKTECDLPLNATLAVYETEYNREIKRVAELRVHSFLQPPSTYRGSLDKVISYFKMYGHDIRFWCSEHHEANLYKETDRNHSTSRMGFMPSDAHEHGMLNVKTKISDEQYNFYMPEQSQQPIDTEIHLISSGDGSLENEFEVWGEYSSQDYGNPNPFFIDEMFPVKNSDDAFTQRPSTPSKSTSGSYRPFELYRPRMGETLEAVEQDMLNEDLEIKDAVESSSNPNVVTFEDADENGYASHLYTEEICPGIPENLSKLSNKPSRYSSINNMNMAEPLATAERKRFKTFPISKTEKYIPLNEIIWKAEEPENIYTGSKRNQYKEIYVVSPSTEIETSWVTDRAMDADLQNLYRNPQNLNIESEVPQE